MNNVQDQSVMYGGLGESFLFRFYSISNNCFEKCILDTTHMQSSAMNTYEQPSEALGGGQPSIINYGALGSMFLSFLFTLLPLPCFSHQH